MDVFLGDVSWETSYSLPGEGQPPRVRADLSLDWPTWSQTSYRSWSIGETPDELPEVVVGVALRIQRLAQRPAAGTVLAVLPAESPPIGDEALERSSTTIEEVHGEPGDAGAVRWAVEATYEGSIGLDVGMLGDPTTLEPIVEALVGWISSTLVRLADLPLSFLPPDPPDVDERTGSADG